MPSIPIRNFFFILLMTGYLNPGFCQPAQVNGILNNTTGGKIYLIRPAYPFNVNNVYAGFKEISVNNKGEFDFSVDVAKPEIMQAFFMDSARKNLGKYNFYLSPGDRLLMKQRGTAALHFDVTGKGAQNNKLLAIDDNAGIENFYSDTLPGRAFDYLTLQNNIHKKILKEYIQERRPTPDFITAWKTNLQYEMLEAFFSFSTNNARQVKDAYKRNYTSWQGVLDALYKDAPIVNENAMVATLYKKFLVTYLMRARETQWNLFKTNRKDFLVNWYGKDTASGAAIFAEDKYNDIQQRIIEKNFTGAPREFLYAVVINGALGESTIQNLIPVYEKFKAAYPSSSYIKIFEEDIKNVSAKKKRNLTAGMKFIDGAKIFKNWEDIVAYYKGQTVLLDMWGTWCGPCRRDMDKHSQLIKQHFIGRSLTYLYIANNDTGKEKLWKELIAYFNLEGTHFIAPEQLTNDIMGKVKGQGFPTYITISKDGSFEVFNRGMGLDREALILQIERALDR